MNIDNLTNNIISLNSFLQKNAKSAVNMGLTIRNWLTGYYIVEYEQKGEDKAKYGEKILQNIADEIQKRNVEGFSYTNLSLFRQFYSCYPEIGEVTFVQSLMKSGAILQTVPEESLSTTFPILQTPSEELENTEIQRFNDGRMRFGLNVLQSLSFSHISLLIPLESEIKRTFYAVEAIKGVWSVRELKRQINSLYFERSGLSFDKIKLSQEINAFAEKVKDEETLRNPMVFEFLELPTTETLHEAQLEKALMDNLQQFLLELGYGFCFEARQKRILIDDQYFFIDMVFYHRILKCHIIVELKTEEFTHENVGQLNVYLQYYKHQMMRPDDNPPIGILLCTNSKPQMVKYATADKENLIISEYKLQLPNEKELQNFVEKQVKELK